MSTLPNRLGLNRLVLNRWPPLLAFLIALIAAVPWLRPLSAPRFAPPAPLADLPQHGGADARTRMLPNPAATAHSVTLAELAPGRVAAAWFAGSREGAADVAIQFATFDGKRWSDPRAIVQRQQVQRDSNRLVRKLGNPVLWRDPRGTLHLWFVSVGFGGWAGSAINHSVSADAGAHWSPAQRLITSPFWNLSTLAHSPPVALADGGLALPVYHEFIAKRGEWLRLGADGRPVDKRRLPGAARSLQPAPTVFDGQRAVLLLRDTSPLHRIRASATNDGGRSWTSARALDLPNPNAGIALLRLHDGRLMLAYNPQESNRTRLALALSSDDGATWSPPRLVEDGQGEDEFSYPALLQQTNGMIHLAYTWQRQQIKHMSFGPDWLKEMH